MSRTNLPTILLMMACLSLSPFARAADSTTAATGETGAAASRAEFTRMYGKGDVVSMLALADKYIGANPHDAMAYFFRGLAQSRGRTTMERGIVDVDKAIALDPNIGEFYGLKASMMHDQQDDELALPIADKAYRMSPKRWDFVDLKASILSSLHKPADGLQLSDQAISHQPGVAKYHYTRAQLLKQLSRWQAAEADLDSAVKLNPGFVLYLLDRMSVCARLKKPDKIIEDADYLVAHDPKRLCEAYERRGKARVMQKNYALAIADYQQAIKESRTEALVRQLHVELQEAYQLSGDMKGVENEKRFLKKLDDDIKPL